MSGISTHVLDISLGQPAAGIPVTLERNDKDSWHRLSTWTTDNDGRVKQLLPHDTDLQKGMYRLTFVTEGYFDVCGVKGLYPVVQITFTVTDSSGHFHIPLLLTANGYSTYRGS